MLRSLALRHNNELPFRGVIAAGMPIEAVEQDETIDLTSLYESKGFAIEISKDACYLYI